MAKTRARPVAKPVAKLAKKGNRVDEGASMRGAAVGAAIVHQAKRAGKKQGGAVSPQGTQRGAAEDVQERALRPAGTSPVRGLLERARTAMQGLSPKSSNGGSASRLERQSGRRRGREQEEEDAEGPTSTPRSSGTQHAGGGASSGGGASATETSTSAHSTAAMEAAVRARANEAACNKHMSDNFGYPPEGVQGHPRFTELSASFVPMLAATAAETELDLAGEDEVRVSNAGSTRQVTSDESSRQARAVGDMPAVRAVVGNVGEALFPQRRKEGSNKTAEALRMFRHHGLAELNVLLEAGNEELERIAKVASVTLDWLIQLPVRVPNLVETTTVQELSESFLRVAKLHRGRWAFGGNLMKFVAHEVAVSRSMGGGQAAAAASVTVDDATVLEAVFGREGGRKMAALLLEQGSPSIAAVRARYDARVIRAHSGAAGAGGGAAAEPARPVNAAAAAAGGAPSAQDIAKLVKANVGKNGTVGAAAKQVKAYARDQGVNVNEVYGRLRLVYKPDKAMWAALGVPQQ